MLWAFGVPTAGWRNAPAYSPRGSTRGSAKLLGRSSLGARTQEHTDLEWFGPPERNTLHPLCGVLSMNESILCPAGLESLSSSERLPFIDQGDAYTGVQTLTGGSNVDV